MLFVLTISIFLLSSCNASKAPNDTIQTDIQQINFDNIIEIESFCKGGTFNFYDYEITKRQTNSENKEDVIFCDIFLSNEFYNITIQEKLLYNYYDEGGWKLENNYFISKCIEANSAPDSSSVINCIKNNKIEYKHKYNRDVKCFFCTYDDEYYSLALYNNKKSEMYFDKYELEKIEFDKATQKASVNFKVSSNVLSANISYPLECDSEDGWISEQSLGLKENEDYNICLVLNFEYNYDKLIGKTYKISSMAGTSNLIRIDSVNSNFITITGWNSYLVNNGTPAKTIDYIFNPLSSMAKETGYDDSSYFYKYEYRYIPSKDVWSNGGIEYYKPEN